MLAGGWVALTRQGAQVAGVSFWEAFDHRGPVASALDATRFGRQFGRGIDVTAVFTILVALAYATVGVSRRLTAVLAVPAAIAGAWALAAPGISGHAGDPGRGPLVIGLDALHVAAAAIWIGGLVQLAVVTPHATRGLAQPLRDADPRQDRRALLADGGGRRGGAGGDRRPAGAVGAVLRVADLDDLLRPHAAGKDACCS